VMFTTQDDWTSMPCTLMDVMAVSAPSLPETMANLVSVSGIGAVSDQRCEYVPSKSCVVAWPSAPGDVLFVRVSGCGATAAQNVGVLQLTWSQLAGNWPEERPGCPIERPLFLPRRSVVP
jgi:hypothetical protein